MELVRFDSDDDFDIDDDHVRMYPHKRQAQMSSCLWTTLLVFLELMCIVTLLLCSGGLTTLLSVLTGLMTKLDIVLWMLLSFVIMQLLFTCLFLCWQKHRNTTSVRKRLCFSVFELIVLFVVGEFVLAMTVPGLSVYENMYSKNALKKGTHALQYSADFQDLDRFYSCNVDVDAVRVRDMSSSPLARKLIFTDLDVFTVSNTIYLTAKGNEVFTGKIFARELAIVWQYETRVLTGRSGMKHLRDKRSQKVDLEYLDSLKKAGRKFSGLPLALQVSIIGEYYEVSRNLSNLEKKEYESLEYYATSEIIVQCN